MKRFYIIVILILISLISGCLDSTPDNATEELRISTTSSTCDTGILDLLNKEFENANNAKILTVCQGTGKAIATGEMGAADVVFVHAPASELTAVEKGSFINRTYVMYNYFVIIGPGNDPAGIRATENAPEALGMIAGKEQPFISRGDDSGTHNKEKAIWMAANITPSGTWYQSVGKGMGDTIMTADIREAYTLSDRGTYLAMKDKTKLVILFETDKEYLFNPYHVMAVNPEKFPDVKYDMSMKYINFLTSTEVQAIIRDYGKDKFDEPLFTPALI
ncbi:MAG: substrate-binding domain-containing protein [Candidatus Methanoperedenaceae archaeon]|nr:substrate-binding domain-containing protein [Candidatus Methanoperedenaceae archaeon]